MMPTMKKYLVLLFVIAAAGILYAFDIEYDSGGGSNVQSLGDLSDVDTSGQSSGKVLKYDGSNWVADTDVQGSGGGTSQEWFINLVGNSSPVATVRPDETQFTGGGVSTFTLTLKPGTTFYTASTNTWTGGNSFISPIANNGSPSFIGSDLNSNYKFAAIVLKSTSDNGYWSLGFIPDKGHGLLRTTGPGPRKLIMNTDAVYSENGDLAIGDDGKVGINNSTPMVNLHGLWDSGSGPLVRFATGTISQYTDLFDVNGSSAFFGVPLYLAGFNDSCTALETDANGQIICGQDASSSGGGDQWGSHTATRPVNYADQPFFGASSGTVNGDMKIGILIVTGSIQGQGADDPLFFTTHTVFAFSIGGSTWSFTASSGSYNNGGTPVKISTGDVAVQDEGTDIGSASKINITGSGATASRSADVITIDVSAAGGTADGNLAVQTATKTVFMGGFGFDKLSSATANNGATDIKLSTLTVEGTITSTSNIIVGGTGKFVGDGSALTNLPGAGSGAVFDSLPSTGIWGNNLPSGSTSYIQHSSASTGGVSHQSSGTVSNSWTVKGQLIADVTDFFAGGNLEYVAFSTHVISSPAAIGFGHVQWLKTDSTHTHAVYSYITPPSANTDDIPVLTYLAVMSTGFSPNPIYMNVAVGTPVATGIDYRDVKWTSTTTIVLSSATAGIRHDVHKTTGAWVLNGWNTAISDSPDILIKMWPWPDSQAAARFLKSPPAWGLRRRNGLY